MNITFKGELKYVIDTGIAYTTSYDAKRYCFVDGKNYTTQANIGQRCGRTGRTCSGTCIQLYTQNQC
jgi:HrpA-like RNA helicase